MAGLKPGLRSVGFRPRAAGDMWRVASRDATLWRLYGGGYVEVFRSWETKIAERAVEDAHCTYETDGQDHRTKQISR